MKTSPSDWVQWDKKEVLPFNGGISFQLRTTKPCTVTNEFGLILGFGSGHQEVVVTGDGEINFSCTSDIWLRPSSRVQERLQRSTEIFTSLDRPSPLSPEMLAIQRMVRRNEIERERDRQEMEKRFADRSREDNRSKSAVNATKTSAKEKEEVLDDVSHGGGGAENEKPNPGEDAAASGIPEPRATSNGGGSPDSA